MNRMNLTWSRPDQVCQPVQNESLCNKLAIPAFKQKCWDKMITMWALLYFSIWRINSSVAHIEAQFRISIIVCFEVLLLVLMKWNPKFGVVLLLTCCMAVWSLPEATEFDGMGPEDWAKGNAVNQRPYLLSQPLLLGFPGGNSLILLWCANLCLMNNCLLCW